MNGVTEVDLERYDGYYADSPKGKPAIGKIVIHEVPDSATEMAELLGGRADWIWKFSPDQFDAVGRMPNLQATRAESMRIEYLGMDAAGRTGADNPLTKEKVRQAIVYAIDRATMAKQLMQGGSRAIDTPCYPTQFGCDAGAAVHYPYDPAKAKQLLAEAGYPNGFDTELVTYDLPQWGGAVQGYLKAVGINAKITQLQVAAVVQRSLAGQNPMELGSWGSYSVNDVSAILPNYLHVHGQRLHARSGDQETGGGRQRDGGSRPAAQGVQRSDQADHREGVMGADLHPHGDLRLFEAAQLQAVSGRAATVLPGKLEVAALCLDRA